MADPLEPRPCATCGIPYQPPNAHPQNRYCSDRCRQTSPDERRRWRENKREKRAAGERDNWSSIPQSVRDRVRIPVLERDGYRCQIRGRRCAVVATDVDHIVSRQDGGALLDPANLRAACAPCNRGRRKGGSSTSSVSRPGPSREW